ncbi:MAG: cation:proton antiporter [Bryobacterales bacterium]
MLAQAAEEHGAEGGGEHHVSQFLFELVAILVAAKVGGGLFERMKQPAVLGELVFGMILGNLNLIGWHFMSGFKNDEMLALAAEIGVILLLFEVGLESNIDELLAVGASAMLVAVLGVIAPVVLGYGVSIYFLPDDAWYVHLFVGATLLQQASESQRACSKT